MFISYPETTPSRALRAPSQPDEDVGVRLKNSSDRRARKRRSRQLSSLPSLPTFDCETNHHGPDARSSVRGILGALMRRQVCPVRVRTKGFGFPATRLRFKCRPSLLHHHLPLLDSRRFRPTDPEDFQSNQSPSWSDLVTQPWPRRRSRRHSVLP